MESSTKHIAMVVTYESMGHLIPTVEFTVKLHRNHNISSTLIIPTVAPLSDAQKSFLADLPPAIDCIILPPVSLDDLPPTVKIETRLALTTPRSLHLIRDAVVSISASRKISFLVADMFTIDSFDIANEFNIPPYLFFPAAAMSLCVFLYLPTLDKTVSCEFTEVPGKLQIPGCIPIHGKDLFNPLQDRKDEAYRCLLHFARKYATAEGIIVNSFNQLEPQSFEALQNAEICKPAVYPIGPLIQIAPKSQETDPSSSHPALKWLDEQPTSSVVFVCLGTLGTLSHEQTIELALGLEMSEQRFLWVLRYPHDKSSDVDPFSYLPENFLERTKNRGLVVPLWAPQAKVLAHRATCAFVSHCGWSSTLESVINGVPVITWPIYAEQKMNAVLLHEVAKVALRPKIRKDGLVERVEICNVVKSMMEGEEGKGIRSRMKALEVAAAEAIGKHGNSTPGLVKLAEKWRS